MKSTLNYFIVINTFLVHRIQFIAQIIFILEYEEINYLCFYKIIYWKHFSYLYWLL